MIKFGPIKNLDGVKKYFEKNVPRGAKKAAVEAFAEYMVGDGTHGLSKDDPYRKTTRKAVYGRTFESDKQRRYVMWMIKNGVWSGQRMRTPTDASQGYGYRITRGGYGATITNTEESAHWTRKWGGWKNWRSYKKVIADNMKGAMRHVMSKVNATLRKK